MQSLTTVFVGLYFLIGLHSPLGSIVFGEDSVGD